MICNKISITSLITGLRQIRIQNLMRQTHKCQKDFSSFYFSKQRLFYNLSCQCTPKVIVIIKDIQQDIIYVILASIKFVFMSLFKIEFQFSECYYIQCYVTQ